jgi:biopolymer transport protein ExbD
MARKRRSLFTDDTDDVDVDMSPMIDLVFLLLIFFMTSSTMITYAKDKRVKIPLAEDAKVPKLIKSRVVVNIYADGTIADEKRAATYTPADITRIMIRAKEKNPSVRLHLRADRRVAHSVVKEVIAASAEAGVNDVILSTYVSDN